jgi:tetratricopeptide (TPR) repeat protein
MPQGLKPRPEFLGLLRWKDQDSLLKAVFLSGIILAVLICGALTAGFLIRPKNSAVPSFHDSLREYDAVLRRGGEAPESLEQMLDKLETESRNPENLLSVFKRRRALVQAHPRFLPQYQRAAQKAAAAYPYSEALAAVAAAALIRDRAISADTAAELRSRLPLLVSTESSSLRASLHILLGDFKTPREAAEVPLAPVLAAALPRLRVRVSQAAAETLITGLAILKILDGDPEGAAAEIQGGLYTGSPSPVFRRFAAEYFYDYRDPLRAAELLSQLDTPADISRQADALWLSGRPGSARILWTLLVSPAAETEVPIPADITVRALYNLAVSAGDEVEAAALFDRLLGLLPPVPPAAGNSPDAGVFSGPDKSAARIFTYGIIRYSRMVNTPAALADLEAGLARFPRNPLLELELLRRRGRDTSWELDRVIGETWLLLGRYPQTEELYQWGAWYFEFQRRPAETAALLKAARRRGIEPPWFRLHEALGLIGSGDLDQAETILRTIPSENAGWEVFANLGRILETRRAPAAAIEAYETAASIVQDRQEAARIQLHIARCLKALDRSRESRRVLEYARDLDPNNLMVRLELKRLDSPENF